MGQAHDSKRTWPCTVTCFLTQPVPPMHPSRLCLCPLKAARLTAVFQNLGLTASAVLCCAVQVAWHPHSPGHLVVLASDNVLRLYSLSDLTLAEQSFHLHPGSPAGSCYSTVGTHTPASDAWCQSMVCTIKQHSPL